MVSDVLASEFPRVHRGAIGRGSRVWLGNEIIAETTPEIVMTFRSKVRAATRVG